MKTKKNLDFFFDRFVIEQGNSGPNFMLIAHSYQKILGVGHIDPHVGHMRDLKGSEQVGLMTFW